MMFWNSSFRHVPPTAAVSHHDNHDQWDVTALQFCRVGSMGVLPEFSKLLFPSILNCEWYICIHYLGCFWVNSSSLNLTPVNLNYSLIYHSSASYTKMVQSEIRSSICLLRCLDISQHVLNWLQTFERKSWSTHMV